MDRYTPRCKCNTPAVLRCAQRKKESKGRYMWMCHVGNKPGEQGYVFSFFFFFLNMYQCVRVITFFINGYIDS